MKQTIKKECKTHGLTNHFKRPDTKTTYRCRKCSSDAVAKRRRKVKLMAIEYKGGKCKLCGYKKCVSALTFHHRDPSKKDFGIAANGHCWAWETIKKELDKCILVCFNCHQEIHDGLRKT